MIFTVQVTESAKKELRRLPEKAQDKILEKIEALSQDPKPFGVKKLWEFKLHHQPPGEYYRIRIGDYRVIYIIINSIVTITVVKIAHRKEVYD